MAKIQACNECNTVHWSLQPHATSTVVKSINRNGDNPPVTLHQEDDVTIPKQRRWESRNKDKYLAWRREYMRGYRQRNKEK